MKSIGPYEILSPGTHVAVKAYRGVVVSRRVADNGVVVHTIKATVKRVRTVGVNYKNVPVNETFESNYSFVYVV